MLRKAIIAIAGIAAALGLVISLQPAAYKVSRTTQINAPPERVFALLNDYRKWDGWSPWAKLDPNMKTTYSGPDSGAGASYHWVGNDDVGEGRMTNLESRASEYLKIRLEFVKPFESTALTEFTLKPEGAGGTRVSWDMSGDQNFVSKAFSLFMGGMDGMIGADFDKGLAQLKRLAEPAN